MSVKTKPTVCDLNDRFRKGDNTIPGSIVITTGLNALLDEHERPLDQLAKIVADYDAFTPDNDPHKEHDFGSFSFLEQHCFWKIDVFDKSMKWAAESPDDPANSRRVLTIMLAEEY